MTTTTRIRKSERLSKGDYSRFIKWINKQNTLGDAAELLGVSRQTLDRLRFKGSGNPDTIIRIKDVICTQS